MDHFIYSQNDKYYTVNDRLLVFYGLHRSSRSDLMYTTPRFNIARVVLMAVWVHTPRIDESVVLCACLDAKHENEQAVIFIGPFIRPCFIETN